MNIPDEIKKLFSLSDKEGSVIESVGHINPSADYIGWRFPKLDGGNVQGFNNSGIETFNGSEMYESLAREICQNSLDARRMNAEGPVEVSFTLKALEISKVNEISQLFDVIDRCKDYWATSMDDKMKLFFGEMDALRKNDEISMLVIGDKNTTGGTDAKACNGPKSRWGALTKSDGVSQKEEGSGGSYGIGKNAPFACSKLRTVFYNTYAIDGIRAFQGTTRLMTHEDEQGYETIGTGNYCNKKTCQNKDTRGAIFEEDKCPFRDLFTREEYGTDVIVIGFSCVDDWQDAIERAVVKNFFVAIYEEKLVVKIDNRIVDKESLYEIIRRQAISDIALEVTKELYEARAFEDHVVKKFSLVEEDDVYLYLRVDENYKRQVCEMRNTGMVIRTRGKNVPKAYSAVVEAKGQALNVLLKDMEPPRHDKWDPKIINNTERQKEAERVRKEIVNRINKFIETICEGDKSDDVDPDGISQFLPDDIDDGTKNSNKKSISLDSSGSVQKVIKRKNIVTNIQTAGYATEGVEDAGDVHNTSSGAEGGHGETHSGNSSDGGTDKIAKPGEGTKTINRPILLKQRVYQKKGSDDDMYHIAIMMQDNAKEVYLSLSSIGDDGTSEIMPVRQFEIHNQIHVTNSDKIGPLNLSGGVMEQIVVKLQASERLRLRLDVR